MRSTMALHVIRQPETVLQRMKTQCMLPITGYEAQPRVDVNGHASWIGPEQEG